MPKGLRVVSVTRQIDFNGTVGKLLAAVLLGIAEMEQETRRERQAAGIAVAKKAGKFRGRKVGTTKAEPARAWKLREKGLSAEEIAKSLGVSRKHRLRVPAQSPGVRPTEPTLFRHNGENLGDSRRRPR